MPGSPLAERWHPALTAQRRVPHERSEWGTAGSAATVRSRLHPVVIIFIFYFQQVGIFSLFCLLLDRITYISPSLSTNNDLHPRGNDDEMCG